jgi:hypothetical protein
MASLVLRRTHPRFCLGTAVILSMLVAQVWVELLRLLSYPGPVHCGTPFLNIHYRMMLFTAVSLPIFVRGLYSYRRDFAPLNAGVRFIIRFPFIILVAMLLAYWGMVVLVRISFGS